MKKPLKIKSPVQIRTRELKNGCQSLYLDIYTGQETKRVRENLKLFIVPERTSADRIANQNAMRKAEALRLIRIEEISKGTYTPKQDKNAINNNISILEFIDTLENCKNYQNLKAILKAQNKNYLISDYTTEIVREFLQFLKNEYKTKHGKRLNKTSIALYFSHLKCIINAAYKRDLISINPLSKLDRNEKPKMPERAPKFLTDSEINILQNSECALPILKQAFLFSVFTGLRISDIRSLKWDNIKTENGVTFIRKDMVKIKDKKINLPLSEQAKKYLPERGKGFVFEGLPKQANTIIKHLTKWANNNGINKHISFHMSRHTCATELLFLGADLYTVSKILGHSTITTTQIYAHIMDKEKINAVSLFDKHFN